MRIYVHIYIYTHIYIYKYIHIFTYNYVHAHFLFSVMIYMYFIHTDTHHSDDMPCY